MIEGTGNELAGGAGGTYVLVLPAEGCAIVQIGRLGALSVSPGHYLYVGSALGPGGLKARLGHHLHSMARPRWHIDYLRKVLSISEIWYACDLRRWESAWAQALAERPGITAPLPGFGASDRPGATHLFHSRRRPILAHFRAWLGTARGGPAVGRLSVGETGS